MWDIAGRRTRLTYPGSGLFVDYDYLLTGETTKIRENGATTGIGVLATLGYDNLGRRTSLTRGNGTATSYAYDQVSRLSSLTQELAGTTNDLTIGPMSYNSASQLIQQTRSNDLYAFTGLTNGNTGYTTNGLNQYATVGGPAATYDPRGNMTSDPAVGKTYSYSSENMLTSASGGVTLAYDQTMRLYQFGGASTARFAYDGRDIIAEYDGTNALLRRFVHGPAEDERLVQYDGGGTSTRRWLHADERGSIIAISDASGNATTVNRYDEYGSPQATNGGRFQYTGQVWLPELGLYHYKARMYAPHLGRFMQTDPIGYEDGINWYVYAGDDPVNYSDPSGESRIEGVTGYLSGATLVSMISGAMMAEEAAQELNKNPENAGWRSASNLPISCESSVTCNMARDDREYFEETISKEEHIERAQARGAGAVGAWLWW